MKKTINTLKITSFNIRCYGLNGEYNGRMGDERRNQQLKEFIFNFSGDSDILFFQEIIDVEMFRSIISDDYKIHTYDHPYKRHQKIVICYKNEFEIANDDIISSVAMNNKTSRPAIYCKLMRGGEPILNLIGVHLKSGSTHTMSRVNQAEEIIEFINNLEPSLPIVIAGDFNTRISEVTGHNDNDVDLLESVFNQIELKRVPNKKPTYHTPWEEHCLDHFWVSNKLCINNDFQVFDVLGSAEPIDMKQLLQRYYQGISDHLPVKIKLQLML